MFSFLAIKARKMCFTIFQNETTSFQAIKTRSSNSQTLKNFQKGLVDGFGQKLTISPCFHFWQYSAGKCVLRYSSTKAPLQTMTTRNQKSREIEIFQNGLTHNFSPKMAIFQIIFQAIQATNLSSTIFYNDTTAFQVIKKRSSKSRKIDIFAKGLTHGFCPKMAIFPIFFFQAIQARKMSFTIFQNEKTPFQAIKTKSSKTRKIHIFPKGLVNPWFWPKNGHISNFFFLGNIGQENVFYDILERKNTLLA